MASSHSSYVMPSPSTAYLHPLSRLAARPHTPTCETAPTRAEWAQATVRPHTPPSWPPRRCTTSLD
ncbi:hypothetical protein BCR44DRAFT_1422767, partial [Catenaria anguillulae PL171]